MSLLDDLQRTVDHVGNAIGHAVGSAAGAVYSTATGDQAGGQRIEHDIDAVSDALFFDGLVKGTNPALIHKYFNDGPGIKSWAVAEATTRSLKGDYDDYGTRTARLTSLLEQAWQGQAAQQGLASVRQSQTILQSMSQHMGAKQSAYGNQIGVFDTTKNSLVPLPDNPPPATNPMSMDVVSTASGAVAASVYQEGVKTNQQAYSNYQPPTQSHTSTIPKGDTITPGQSNPTPGPTPPGGPGINEPRAYNPTSGNSQYVHSGTDRQQGSGAQPFGNGGGQPGGFPVAQPPVYSGSDGASTGLAGYSGPLTGTGGLPTQGSYDTGFGPRGSADGGFGSGSVFAGGGFAGGGFEGSGSGYGSGGGAAAGRGGAPGLGNAAGAGAAGEAMAGRAGAAGTRGAAGQAGAGAAGAGGRGGKKEEDKEHKTAAYLVTEEHGTEVVGKLPSALPPGGVIGG